MATTNSAVKTVEVTLIKKHTHAGKDYPVGATLAVPPHVARWMLNNKVIAKIPGEAKAD